MPDTDDTPLRVMPGRNESPALKKQRRGNFKNQLNALRLPALTFLGLVSLALGTVGYEKYAAAVGVNQSLATSFYMAVGLFKLSGGSLISPIPWELELARWLSPAAAMYAVIASALLLFSSQLTSLKLKFLRGHIVVVGLGPIGMNLASDFRSAGSTVVIVEKDSGNPRLAHCRELGITAIIGDGRNEGILRKAGIERAKNLICITCGDDVNLDIAIVARKIVKKRNGGKLNCAVHIIDPNLWVCLRDQEFLEEDVPLRLDLFNLYDQAARQLLTAYPLSQEGRDDISPLAFMDCGPFTEHLIVNAVRTWRLVNPDSNRKLHITLIDPDADTFVEQLCQRYSLVREHCDWKTRLIQPGSVSFPDAIFGPKSDDDWDGTTFLINLDDEKLGLRIALSILHLKPGASLRIIVKMDVEKGFAHLINKSIDPTSDFKDLHIFSMHEHACRKDMVFQSTHERIAQAIHADYLKRERAKGLPERENRALVEWPLLSEDLKEMNRTQADQIGRMLREVGCEIIPWYQECAECFEFSPDEVELLAKMEHKRWCVQKNRQGWKYGKTRNDPKKLHPSLVEWDAPSFSEAEKDKDRDAVRSIPAHLALAGYQIHRRLLVRPV